MSKKIILTGATGLIGQKLHTKLVEQGDEVTIFTRMGNGLKRNILNNTEIIKWNYNNPEEWKNNLEGKDAIIHLAGSNLAARRWNDKYKREIYNSRILSTRNIVNAIKSSKEKPELLLTTSAVGIYGDRGDELLAEDSKNGNDFLAEVCNDWENEAAKVEESEVRRISLRIGPVLSKNGGALKRILIPFKLFVGGPLGNGNQWFPWIHEEDVLSIFIHVLNKKSLKGPVNASSPTPVTMKQFANTLGKLMKRPAFFSVPKFIIKLVAGEITDSVLSSQRISVTKLLNSGFKFRFEDLEKALKNLLDK